MDIHTARQQLKTRTIYDLPLRVTFYARVSSESDEQLNSLGNQVSYYEDLIARNANWTYVDGYIDEGLSAATTKNRENFHRMVEDGKSGVFDLIITKEITRFARNTLDSIQYTRDLLNAGVGVFFQNDNINTLDEDSELRLTIMSGIAQDELRKLSSRVKFGHAQAIKKSVVLGNSRIFGYIKDGGRLVIDEGEAPMVRELFELYATGEYSMKQIETLFWDKGYRNHNGKKIAHTTMSGMISNPKYKGYYVGNKVKVIDLFTKKQKFLPPEEWVMFKDETGEIVPAIVDEDLWEQANKVLQKRSEDVKGRQGICNHANLLTGKLFCTDCGTAYYRRDSVDRQGNKNSKWVCSGKIKNGADSCASFPIYEEELKPLLFEVFQETEADADALIEEYIEMYKSLGDSDTSKQIEALLQQVELAQKKKSKLLGYNATGQLSDRDFLSMNKECDREIDEAERQIYDLEQQQLSKAEFKKHIDTIRRVLREAKRDAAQGIINKEFVDRYIDKIFVTPEDGRLKLQIKIFTGESTDKYLQNLRKNTARSAGWVQRHASRTGHTFKDVIETYLPGSDYLYCYRGDFNPNLNPNEAINLVFADENGVPRTSDAPSTPTNTPSTPATPSTDFTDVAADAYYAAPVAWAVEKEITSGTGNNKFSPDQDCTNAQILTFIWRAYGKPEPTIDNPFTNSVPEAYAKAAIWAYEKGMVSGTTFDTDKPCTRAMAAIYLWQAAGSPTAPAASFTDVPADAAYAQAVAWAVEQKITAGTSATTFSPDDVCNRGQIVTFLHRNLA